MVCRQYHPRAPSPIMYTIPRCSSVYIRAILFHDDIIKWKHFPRYWPFVRGIHRSPTPVTRSFDVFFDLRLNKRLSKQSWGWWCGTPWCSLWRHCNIMAVSLILWMSHQWEYVNTVLVIWKDYFEINLGQDASQRRTKYHLAVFTSPCLRGARTYLKSYVN